MEIKLKARELLFLVVSLMADRPRHLDRDETAKKAAQCLRVAAYTDPDPNLADHWRHIADRMDADAFNAEARHRANPLFAALTDAESRLHDAHRAYEKALADYNNAQPVLAADEIDFAQWEPDEISPEQAEVDAALGYAPDTNDWHPDAEEGPAPASAIIPPPKP